jgi:hypothetical protein
MTTPLEKWVQIKDGKQVAVTDKDLDWMADNLSEPDATLYFREVASIFHPEGYVAKLGSFPGCGGAS